MWVLCLLKVPPFYYIHMLEKGTLCDNHNWFWTMLCRSMEYSYLVQIFGLLKELNLWKRSWAKLWLQVIMHWLGMLCTWQVLVFPMLDGEDYFRLLLILKRLLIEYKFNKKKYDIFLVFLYVTYLNGVL